MELRRIDILLTVLYLGVLVLSFLSLLITHVGILSVVGNLLSPVVGGVFVGYFGAARAMRAQARFRRAVNITILGSLLYPVVVLGLIIGVQPIFDAVRSRVHAQYPLVIMMASVVAYVILYIPLGMVGVFIGAGIRHYTHS